MKRPQIKALVLAGGRSVRMGQDKGLIAWYGKPQRYHLADLLTGLGFETYISCRDDQVTQIENEGYYSLVDTAPIGGQFGAILSAFRVDPDAAWLVVATDLPFFNEQAVDELVSARQSDKIATAFKGRDDLPEPLAAIWEPISCLKLENEMANGITCPRKVLIRAADEVALLAPSDDAFVDNVNTPDAAAVARARLKNDQSV